MSGLHTLVLCASALLAAASEREVFDVGAAQIDITPPYPVPLNGYLARRDNPFFDSVAQRIFATALVIGARQPAVLITVDNCAVPGSLVQRVRTELTRKLQTDPARIAVSCSHSHATPCLSGAIPNIFGRPFAPQEQEAVQRYTEFVARRLVQVAEQAASTRQPAKLEWTVGQVTFAANRRPQGGPVDHSLPLLRAVSVATGQPVALLLTYACHCTTTRAIQQVHGDWAGVAREQLHRRYGVPVLVSIGCGADANPKPRGSIELAERHGRAIAEEVTRLMAAAKFRPVRGPLRCRIKTIRLPFDRIPTAEQLRAQAKAQTPAGHRARLLLARLEQEGKLPEALDYVIQSWAFGDDLCMVFLAGEVVVDYALRLRRELDGQRLWVHAYTNDVPCYIASRRVLREGGYEADGSMIYYAQPSRLALEVEDILIDGVLSIVPPSFYGEQNRRRMPPPRTPEQTLRTIHVPDGFQVELVASEPQIRSPVAIDFGPDGSLWVVEMYDYPTGVDEAWQPGGRIRVLHDRDRDGFYETAVTFLDGIPFPTGLLVWGRGAFVCAAPDILYAEDLDGDGRADRVRKLYSGFATHNYQARVNSLRLGLDGWIYGANGLFGGTIRSPFLRDPVSIDGRDFRFWPGDWRFEPVSGLSQQGRVRDDWGNWFGTTNANLLSHYIFPQELLRAVPGLAAPPVAVRLAGSDRQRRLYPASPPMERFNQPQQLNYVTSACGPTVYRDRWLDEALYGDVFVCEPVHNVVVHRKLVRRGTTFELERIAGEQPEFFAAEDPWCRPVEVRTGPDGALWVVDMYRFVIEHPRWIPPHILRRLDVRAGADRGRIYRVVPSGQRPEQHWYELASASEERLAEWLAGTNGTLRDMVQREVVLGRRQVSHRRLARIVRSAAWPAARVQAAWLLAWASALDEELVLALLADEHPELRRNAIRLAVADGAPSASVRAALERLADDERAEVRFQLAIAISRLPDDARRYELAAALAADPRSDQYIRAAALAGGLKSPPRFLAALNAHRDRITEALLVELAKTLRRGDNPPGAAHALAALLRDVARSQGLAAVDTALAPAADLLRQAAEADGAVARWLARCRDQLKRRAQDEGLGVADRFAALAALSALGGQADRQLRALAVELLLPHRTAELRRRVVAFVASKGVSWWQAVLTRWHAIGPEERVQLIERWLQTELGRRWLIEQLDRDVIAVADLTPAHRQRLAAALGGGPLAKRLAAGVASTRRPLVARYLASAPAEGDPERGRALFERHCAACHRFGARGADVGPNLAELTARDRRTIFTAVLDPNAAVDPRYFPVTVLTRDGRVVTGLIVEQAAETITLALADGTRQQLARTEIDQIRVVRRSLMPEGFEEQLSPRDLADLTAFLAHGAPEARRVVAVATNQPTTLSVASARGSGGASVMRVNGGGVGKLVWQIELPRAGMYAVWLDWCLPGKRSAVQARVSVMPEGGAWEFPLPATGAEPDLFRQAELARVRLPQGQAQLELLVRHRGDGAAVRLRGVVLVPVSQDNVAR